MPEERIYIIPLRRAKDAPRNRRVPRAVKIVQEYLKRHMKSDKIKLNEELNQKLWERGIEHVISRVRVRAVKADDGSVEAFLAE
jgi:large subunit ribosomal protein L31e